MFVPENDKLAEEGSNMRSDQNRSIAYWRDFVLDKESKYGVLVLPNKHALRLRTNMVLHLQAYIGSIFQVGEV